MGVGTSAIVGVAGIETDEVMSMGAASIRVGSGVITARMAGTVAAAAAEAPTMPIAVGETAGDSGDSGEGLGPGPEPGPLSGPDGGVGGGGGGVGVKGFGDSFRNRADSASVAAPTAQKLVTVLTSMPRNGVR